MKVQEVGILIVDDVNAMRIEIKSLLKNFGFENILLASNGIEARQALESNDVHFILSDWHMGPMDGIELLKYVRSSDKYKTIPFVMVSAESIKEQVIMAVASGIDDYILKPLTIDQIQNKVFNLLVKKKVLI